MRTLPGRRDTETHWSLGEQYRALHGHPAWRDASSDVRDFAELVVRRQYRYGVARVSGRSLARHLRCSERTAWRVMRRAQEDGLIIQVRTGGGRAVANAYQLGSCRVLRPPDNRPPAVGPDPSKTAGQTGQNYDRNGRLVVRKDRLVSCSSVGYSRAASVASKNGFGDNRKPEEPVRQPRDWDAKPTCETCSDDGWVLIDNFAHRCECQNRPPTGQHRPLTASATSVPPASTPSTPSAPPTPSSSTVRVLFDTKAGRRVGDLSRPESPPPAPPAPPTPPPAPAAPTVRVDPTTVHAERTLEGPLSAADSPRVGDDLPAPEADAGPLQASIDRLRALAARNQARREGRT